jgi:hypothetical protein
VGGYPIVREGADANGAQAYPDVYVKGNYFGLLPSKVAAGVDVSLTVPFGVFWDVKTLIGTLVTSAGVANRTVGFVVKNEGGSIVYSYQITAAQAASLTGTYCFSEDVTVAPTAFATTNSLLAPMPKAWIPPGWSFGTTTLNIQVADQWSAVGAYVQEWLPPEGC